MDGTISRLCLHLREEIATSIFKKSLQLNLLQKNAKHSILYLKRQLLVRLYFVRVLLFEHLFDLLLHEGRLVSGDNDCDELMARQSVTLIQLAPFLIVTNKEVAIFSCNLIDAHLKFRLSLVKDASLAIVVDVVEYLFARDVP